MSFPQIVAGDSRNSTHPCELVRQDQPVDNGLRNLSPIGNCVALPEGGLDSCRLNINYPVGSSDQGSLGQNPVNQRNMKCVYLSNFLSGSISSRSFVDIDNHWSDFFLEINCREGINTVLNNGADGEGLENNSNLNVVPQDNMESSLDDVSINSSVDDINSGNDEEGRLCPQEEKTCIKEAAVFPVLRESFVAKNYTCRLSTSNGDSGAKKRLEGTSEKRRHGNRKKFMCLAGDCRHISGSMVLLRRHQQKHLPDTTFKCRSNNENVTPCGESFRTQSARSRHESKNHWGYVINKSEDGVEDLLNKIPYKQIGNMLDGENNNKNSHEVGRITEEHRCFASTVGGQMHERIINGEGEIAIHSIIDVRQINQSKNISVKSGNAGVASGRKVGVCQKKYSESRTNISKAGISVTTTDLNEGMIKSITQVSAQDTVRHSTDRSLQLSKIKKSHAQNRFLPPKNKQLPAQSISTKNNESHKPSTMNQQLGSKDYYYDYVMSKRNKPLMEAVSKPCHYSVVHPLTLQLEKDPEGNFFKPLVVRLRKVPESDVLQGMEDVNELC